MLPRRLSYVLSALVTAVLAVACSRGGVIPQKDMVRIYKDLYMADQWIKEATTRSRVADTSYVYRPIIARYGYTEDDFRASIDYYTDRPKEFAGIFEMVAGELNKDKKVVELKEKEQRRRDSVVQAREAIPYRRPDFIHMPPQPDFYIARLQITLDSAINVLRFNPVNIFEEE